MILIIKDLTDKDKGREVRYGRDFCDVEFGKITSWNDHFVFVNYHTKIKSDGSRVHFTGGTSAATEPENLQFTT